MNKFFRKLSKTVSFRYTKLYTKTVKAKRDSFDLKNLELKYVGKSKIPLYGIKPELVENSIIIDFHE